MSTRSTCRHWLTGASLLLACSVSSLLSAASPADSTSFSDWVAGFRPQALQQGISAGLFDQQFRGMTADDSVIKADGNQPEFTRPVWEYIEGATSSSRVSKGRELLEQQRQTMSAIEQRYGVPRNFLVAIWGMESAYGHNIGNKNVIRSLATLAWHGRRADFAREQLIAALQILQQGHFRGSMMPGSWAGAMGQTQFIPTTFRDFAVDFDGDGRKNLWYSTADALGSTASYLQRSGWRNGQSWGMEVFLPAGFDYALADPAKPQSVEQWLALGVRPARELDSSERQSSATLLLPAGHRGPAFLLLPNFRALLTYNNSTAYALGVSLLAERYSGGGLLQASWPLGDVPLSRSQRIELQQQLSRLGFNPGVADGIIGANTRTAVRDSQKLLGWPADGYPSLQLLETLRQMPQ